MMFFRTLRPLDEKPLKQFLQAIVLGSLILSYTDIALGDGRVFAEMHPCAEDSGGVGTCSANEVDIAEGTVAVIDEDVDFCPAGGQVQIRSLVAKYGLNTGVRYDPLLWIGQKGNDPRLPDVDTGGYCYVTSAPESLDYPTLFDDLEGDDNDSCLDIRNPDDIEGVPDPVVLPYEDLDFWVDCQDADGNGIADLHVLVTWLQNTSLACGPEAPEAFGTGAPPKCNYKLISLEIPYDPPTLTIIKQVVNDNGGSAVASDWIMDVTAIDPSDNHFPGAEAPGVTISITAGEYSVDESGGPEGYVKTLGPGCSGSLEPGESATCTITNDDIAPELTVIKHVVNDNGGDAVAAQWTMGVTASNPSANNFPGTEAPGTTITIDAGAYSVDESGGPVGYLKILGEDCSGSLDVGESATCTIINDDIPPQLTVIKHVVNDNGGSALAGQWIMDVTAANPSSTGFPGAEAPGTTITIDAGPYSVDESGGPTGYLKTLGAGCSGNLGLDESATCTITNDDITPELTVIVEVTNDDGGTAVAGDWAVDVTAANPSDSGFPGAEAPGTTITLDAGVYSVALSGGPAGYTVSPGPGCAGTLDPGAIASCTVTIDDISPGPQLTVIKHVVNDNGGMAVAGLWTMVVTASNPSSNNFPGVEAPGVTISIDPGAYSVDESGGPSGYLKTLGAGCSGSLADGESATCTITNDDIAPGLTVIVDVINDDEGTAVAGDWTVDVTAVNPSATGFPGAEAPGTSITIDAGPYSVSLGGGPDGYVLTPGPGCAGALAPGESAVCTITANDEIDSEDPPQLTVIKHVINDDGGTAVASDWTMVVTATNPSDNNFPGAEAPGTTITIDAGAFSVDETDGPEGYTKTLGPGCAGTLEVGESATCTIINDDEGDDADPPADIRVSKTVTPALTDCPILIGETLDFVISVENAGSETAEGVILDEQWSWQLKPSKSPDMYECTEPKPHARRCKLGDMEPGARKDIAIAFMVGGTSAAELCNTATATSNPAEPAETIEDNVGQVCFDTVPQLGVQCDDLSPGMVGIYYDQAVSLTGGTAPTATDVTGLPEDLAGQPGNPVLIEGCPLEHGVFNVTTTVTDTLSCQEDVQLDCPLTVISDPACALAELSPVPVGQMGIPTPVPATLPDESVQKLAVEASGPEDLEEGAPHRYLVGFTYIDHQYASDPNGPYLNPGRNYDMRLTKYDDTGSLVWDRTYDTGNNDYGYAVTLSPDQQTVYVGGGSLRETGPHAWHDAVLLEIDAATGCLVGDHFQSASQGTTSAYYDIATDGDYLYAVGERQVNADIPAGPPEQGALVSLFSRLTPEPARDPGGCDDAIIIPSANIGELTNQWHSIRQAAAGREPVTAYSIELPDPDCSGCAILVGGGAGVDGWIELLDLEGRALTPFLAIPDVRVQDMTAHGSRIVAVGSSGANDMRVFGFDRNGASLWPAIELGKGRLRGVTTDAAGYFYAVGTSDGTASAGLVFKFNPAGVEVDRDQLSAGANTAFHDIGVFDPGFGTIAAQMEEGGSDFSWMQVEFTCDPSCD